MAQMTCLALFGPIFVIGTPQLWAQDVLCLKASPIVITIHGNGWWWLVVTILIRGDGSTWWQLVVECGSTSDECFFHGNTPHGVSSLLSYFFE